MTEGALCVSLDLNGLQAGFSRDSHATTILSPWNWQSNLLRFLKETIYFATYWAVPLASPRKFFSLLVSSYLGPLGSLISLPTSSGRSQRVGQGLLWNFFSPDPPHHPLCIPSLSLYVKEFIGEIEFQKLPLQTCSPPRLENILGVWTRKQLFQFDGIFIQTHCVTFLSRLFEAGT